MNNLTRRDLCVALSAFAAMGGVAAEGQSNASSEAPASSNGTAEPVLAHSEIFPFDKLPVHASANGGQSRAVIQGRLATGEFVEVHETALPPGQMPHQPHRHTHSEFLMIREGKLEVTSDGKTGIVEPGGIIFTASGVLHGLKNVGDVMANYFVVAIGVQKAIV
jgi:quercetin dioxygenase-like cupin family protein